jgi:hypothetical protein
MPSVSKKQHNFMQAVAHSPEFAKKAGVPQSVGKEFAAADAGKTFAKSGRKVGSSNPARQGINKQQTNRGATQLPNVSLNKYTGARSLKFKEGGMAMKHEDVKMDKTLAKKAIHMHESQMHGGKKSDLKGLKKGGMCMANGGYVRSADGCAIRGKTKGTMV